MKTNKTTNRIADRIATAYPLTTVGFIVQDLKLSESTVRRHLGTLVEAGRIELSWDGRAYQATDAERQERKLCAP